MVQIWVQKMLGFLGIWGRLVPLVWGVRGVHFGAFGGGQLCGIVGRTQNPPKYTVFKTPPTASKIAHPAPPNSESAKKG
jgi:hypothetical protein